MNPHILLAVKYGVAGITIIACLIGFFYFYNLWFPPSCTSTITEIGTWPIAGVIVMGLAGYALWRWF